MKCMIYIGVCMTLLLAGALQAQTQSFSLPPSTLVSMKNTEQWEGASALEIRALVTKLREIQTKEYPAGHAVYASVFYETKQGFWCESKNTQQVVLGEPLIFNLDISATSTQWKMPQARRIWGTDTLEWVTRWGIKLFSRSAHFGEIKVLPLQIRTNLTEEIPPVVPRLLESGRHNFNSNYIDFEVPLPNDARIDVVLAKEGHIHQRPAFYLQPYTPKRDPWDLRYLGLSPQGLPRWRVIFSNLEKGSYRVRILTGEHTVFDLGNWQCKGADSEKAVFQPRTIPLSLKRISTERIWRYSPKRGATSFSVHTQPVQQAWHIPLEWTANWGRYRGLGKYDHYMAQEFDEAFTQASRDNKQFPVMLLADFELDNNSTYNWLDNPLRMALRNSLYAGSIFDEPEAVTYLYKRWRYIYARYSHYPAFGGIILDISRNHPRYGEWISAFFDTALELDKDLLCYTSYQGGLGFEKDRPLVLSTALTWESRLSTTGAVEQGKGLILTGTFPGVVSASARGKWHLAGTEYVSFDIDASTELPPYSKMRFILRSDIKRVFQSPLIEVHSGEIRRVRLALDSSWVHTKTGVAMNAPYELLNIEEIAIQLFCDEKGTGRVRASNMRFESSAQAFAPAQQKLELTDFKHRTTSRRAQERQEFSFKLSKVFLNPYDPTQVAVDMELKMPDGSTMKQPAFYYEPRRIVLDKSHEKILRETNSRGEWRVRITPPQQGRYSYTVKVQTQTEETSVSGGFTLKAPDVTAKGTVVVSAKDPRYFEFSNGDFFYPIGINLRSPSDRRPGSFARLLAQKLDAADAQGTFIFEKWFKKMNKQGMNFARIWMAPWWCGIEWNPSRPGYHGIGYYNQDNAARLDKLFSMAEEYGIYINLETSHHGSLSTRVDKDWATNPYNALLPGGMVKDPIAYVNSAEATRLHKMRLRYCVARWGYSQALAFWGVMTEAEFIKPYDKKKHALAEKWLADMAAYIKKTDAHKHIVSAHFSNPWHGREGWKKYKNLEVIHSNAYTTFMRWGWKNQRHRQPKGVVGVMKYFREYLLPLATKPLLIGEWGGDPLKNKLKHLRAELHTGLWAQAIIGVAGNTGFWWWNLLDAEQLFGEYAPVIRFSEGLDLRTTTFKITAPKPVVQVATSKIKINKETGAVEGEVKTYTQKPSDTFSALLRTSQNECWGYVYRNSLSAEKNAIRAKTFDDTRFETVEGLQIEMPQTLQAGEYTIAFWDTYAGVVLKTTTFMYDPAVSSFLDLPPFSSDIAFKLN